MENKIISLQQICKAYDSKSVLTDLSLDININTLNVIMGDSGCGKSTLLNILGLIDFSDSGEYYFMGQSIDKLKKQINEIRNRNIGYVFQSYCLIPNMTVYDNVIIPLLYRKSDVCGNMKKIDDYLRDLGIFDLKYKIIDDLSGGEKQRVAICRILAGDVDVVLADEPTGNLDEKNKSIIVELFYKLVNHYKKTVIIVTHDKSFQKYADKCFLLKNGVIHEDNSK